MIARLSALAAMVAAVAWTYFPAAGFAFLNWDDQSVILRNPSLAFPGVAQVGVDHHLHGALPATQLAGVGGDQGGVRFRPRAFHAANIAAHVVCVLLVYAAARAVLTHAAPEASATLRNGAAVAAALLFGLHPLRVEVVAWISAMPYALALAFLLASLLAYLRTAARTPARLAGGGARAVCRLAGRTARRSRLPGGAGRARRLAAQATHAHEPFHGVAICGAGRRGRRRRERGARARHRRHAVALPRCNRRRLRRLSISGTPSRPCR